MNQPRFVILAVLLDLLIGCGSVAELAATDAGRDQVADAGADLVVVDLDAAPSDTHPENPSDGAAESSPPAHCFLDGVAAMVTENCSSSCAVCHWGNWRTPAPDGCEVAAGVICRPDCAACR